GHNYKIEVNHGGKSYSAASVMRQASTILNLDFQWIKMPYDHVAVLQISFVDTTPDEDCFWIRIYKNGDPYKWLLSDDRGDQNGVILETTMTSRMNLDEEDEKSMLKDGDLVEVAIAPISRNMYDYLNAIQSDSNGPRMFSGDFCLGYYYAGAESRSSIIFRPSEMSFF
ncbi:MAG: hypothetical protein K2K97_10725, partial [Muribaculaceae bacterium]|nr:hypothetical protein [Muribaculaceae bacterium]